MRKINPRDNFYITFFDSLGVPYIPGCLPNEKYLLPLRDDLIDIKRQIRQKEPLSSDEKYLLLRNHSYNFSEEKRARRKQERFLSGLLNLIKDVNVYQNKQGR